MNWRTSGDTTLDAFAALIPSASWIRKNDEITDVYLAASPYSRLVAGMLAAESSYATNFRSVPASMNNPLNLRKRGQSEFQVFTSITECVREWRDRITSTSYAYRNTQSVRELIEIYAPASDGNDVDDYVQTVEAVINRLPRKEQNVAIVFGRVPHPDFQDRPITKPEGVGQNNLGKREVKGVVWHRMLGSLNGTDGYFRNPNVAALTDYGVGVASTDGNTYDGVIYKWNNPLGYQSGWASGQVIAPYGDGLEFVARYGAGGVNRYQASIEISGYYDTALSEKSRQAIAELTAYWADQYKIPWDVFPIAPQDGFSFVRWHQEFTGPAEKQCPGSVVIAETNDLIERTRAIMKLYQEDGTQPEKPKYAPADTPDFLKSDNGLRVESIGSTPVYPINVVFTATKNTKRMQGAEPNKNEVGPPIEKGTRFRATRVFRSRDKVWVLTKNGSRVAAADLTPIITVSVDGYVGIQF